MQKSVDADVFTMPFIIGASTRSLVGSFAGTGLVGRQEVIIVYMIVVVFVVDC